MKKLFLIIISVLMMSATFSCKNQDVEYPNYTYQTIYFAYQSPVRKIVLGDDDQYDNSLDTLHECEIEATIGGEYSSKSNVKVNFKVDNSLCTNVYSSDGIKITAMPSNYYSLDGDSIIIPKGSLMGGVIVHLKDAFFDDAASINVKYVIPLVMTTTDSGDSILQGEAAVSNPNRVNSADWTTVPKDYTLYAIKYINPWTGSWIRRGVDAITYSDGTKKDTVRHAQYIENDDVCSLTSNTLKSVVYPVSITVPVYNAKTNKMENQVWTANLLLTFNDSGQCTITSNTENYPASGSGKFVKKGEKKSWNNKDRDGIYLDYNVNFDGRMYATKDTLVLRDRAEKMETFTPVYKSN